MGGFKRLPQAPARFGRDEQFNQLVGLMMRPDLPAVACVLGPGGIGKSNLCLSALHAKEVKEKFGKRRAFVRCDAATGRESLVKFIAEEIRVEIGPNLEDRVLDELERSPAVVVLDNFESPWERETKAVEDFLAVLANIDGVCVIVGLRGQEKPHRISFDQEISVEKLTPDDAERLFLKVAGPKLASDPALQPLLNEMDYLPLAVELLAYRAQGESSLALLRTAWEEKKTRLLERGKADDRENSLAASIELSFESPRMTKSSKSLATLLGFLPNGVAGDDLQPLLGVEGNEAAINLHSVGLAFSEAGRTIILRPVRQYLNEFHVPSPELLITCCSHFVGVGRIYGEQIGGQNGMKALSKISRDFENIIDSIEFILKSDKWSDGVKSILSMSHFFRFSGISGISYLEKVRKIAEEKKDISSQAICLARIGEEFLAFSKFNIAMEYFLKAEDKFRKVSNYLGIANCIMFYGEIEFRRGSLNKALIKFIEARKLYEKIVFFPGIASSIQKIGSIYLSHSDLPNAKFSFYYALAIHIFAKEVLGQVNCLLSLGEIFFRTNDLKQAQNHFSLALDFSKKSGFLLGQANCLLKMADIDLYYVEYKKASKKYNKAFLLFKEVNDYLGQANVVFKFAEIDLREGKNENAMIFFLKALELYKKSEDIIGQGNCIRSIGDIYKKQGKLIEAKQNFIESLKLFKKIPEQQSIGFTFLRLAEISDDYEREHYISEARRSWNSIGRKDFLPLLDKI